MKIQIVLLFLFGTIVAMEPEEQQIGYPEVWERNKSYYAQLPMDLRRGLTPYLEANQQFFTARNFWAIQDQFNHEGIRTEDLGVFVCDFDPTGAMVLFQERDNTIGVMNKDTREILWRVPNFNFTETMVKYSYNAAYVQVYNRQGGLRFILNASSGKTLFTIPFSPAQWTLDVLIKSENQWYVVAAINNDIYLQRWTFNPFAHIAETIASSQIYIGNLDAIRGATFIDYGSKLAMVYNNAVVRIYDLQTLHRIAEFDVPRDSSDPSECRIARMPAYQPMNLLPFVFQSFTDMTIKWLDAHGILKYQKKLTYFHGDVSFFSRFFRCLINRDAYLDLYDVFSGNKIFSARKNFQSQYLPVSNREGTIIGIDRFLIYMINPTIQKFLDALSYEQGLLLDAAYRAIANQTPATTRQKWWEPIITYFLFPLIRQNMVFTEEDMVHENQKWIGVFQSLPPRLQQTIKHALEHGPAPATVSLQ